MGKGVGDWPAVTEPAGMSGLDRDQKVAVMTYSGDLFSWYAGSVEADVYFCPERHGTYFGSFYLKDAKAMLDPTYAIPTSVTGDMGERFVAALDATQAASINGLVDAQRSDLLGMVDVRRTIAGKLRAFQTGGQADQATVMSLMDQYGRLDGDIVYKYATAFAGVGKTLTTAQKQQLAAMREEMLGGMEPQGAYLFSQEIAMPSSPRPTSSSARASRRRRRRHRRRPVVRAPRSDRHHHRLGLRREARLGLRQVRRRQMPAHLLLERQTHQVQGPGEGRGRRRGRHGQDGDRNEPEWELHCAPERVLAHADAVGERPAGSRHVPGDQQRLHGRGHAPMMYTADGAGVSPPLAWSGAPAGTKEFALTMTTQALDGEKWNWVLYGIPAAATSLAEGTSAGTAGLSTDGPELRYYPPASKGPGAKTYTFTLYALSAAPVFSVPAAEVSGPVLESAIADRTLASAQVSVSYTRVEGAQ